MTKTNISAVKIPTGSGINVFARVPAGIITVPSSNVVYVGDITLIITDAAVADPEGVYDNVAATVAVDIQIS